MMECLAILLGVFAALAWLLGSGMRACRGRGRRRSYQRLAKRFQGRFLSGGILRPPSVSLPYGPRRAMLTEAKAGGPLAGKCTQVTMDWELPQLEFEVVRAAESGAPAARSWSEIPLQGEERPGQFSVRGDARSNVPSLFTDGTCWQLEQVAQVPPTGLYVLARRGRFLVQKPGCIRRFVDLEALVEATLELYAQLELSQAEGIEFLENELTVALEEVVCSVCGDQIVAKMVYCRRCKTPHHEECWRYIGSCSVYGCRETEFLRPQTALSARARTTSQPKKPR